MIFFNANKQNKAPENNKEKEKEKKKKKESTKLSFPAQCQFSSVQ